MRLHFQTKVKFQANKLGEEGYTGFNKKRCDVSSCRAAENDRRWREVRLERGNVEMQSEVGERLGKVWPSTCRKAQAKSGNLAGFVRVVRVEGERVEGIAWRFT